MVPPVGVSRNNRALREDIYCTMLLTIDLDRLGGGRPLCGTLIVIGVT